MKCSLDRTDPRRIPNPEPSGPMLGYDDGGMKKSDIQEDPSNLYLRDLDKALNRALQALAPHLDKQTPEALASDLISFLETHLAAELQIILSGADVDGAMVLDEYDRNHAVAKLHWLYGSPAAVLRRADELKRIGRRDEAPKLERHAAKLEKRQDARKIQQSRSAATLD